MPNKIRTTMGIIADVNLRHESGKEYITISVLAHLNAISYRGKYYYRSGSTNQELTGYALDELLLGKYGRAWDSAPIPHVKPEDFYSDAFINAYILISIICPFLIAFLRKTPSNW